MSLYQQDKEVHEVSVCGWSTLLNMWARKKLFPANRGWRGRTRHYNRRHAEKLYLPVDDDLVVFVRHSMGDLFNCSRYNYYGHLYLFAASQMETLVAYTGTYINNYSIIVHLMALRIVINSSKERL